ncbi:MAG: helix-turn-helix transcriptional regulator [Lactobacillales bacterium]|nr:helix-turn-helix transcriptional regulator [Lactobacillales bacterium]
MIEGSANIVPLRIIRIAKDLSMEEMANNFMVTKAYISAVEKGDRKMKIQTLKFGLDNMNINLDDYFQLEKFSEELLDSELSNSDKFKFMLIKTLGIVSIKLKVKSEEILEKYYNNRNGRNI